MDKNIISKSRKKSKYIIEIRYEALPSLFDKKGQFINSVSDKFKKKLPHWNINDSSIQFFEDTEDNKKTIFINHLHTWVSYEDPDSSDEFVNDVLNYLKIFCTEFKEDKLSINRIGVRYITVHQFPKLKSFHDCLEAVKKTFFADPFPSSLKSTDCLACFTHDTGRYQIGPIKKNEAWCKNQFQNKSKEMPDHGIAFDIDSGVLFPDITGEKSMKENVKAVMNLTSTTELELFDLVNKSI